jgi:hypothetical protein
MEEAAFINANLFYEVIVPLIGVGGTAVIGITTPKSGINYFNELLELKDQHGHRLFLVEMIGLVCAQCLKTGQNCNHLLDLNPSWKPPERMAKVDAIMATNPELRDQETRGQPASIDYILTAKQVESFRTRGRYCFSEGHPNMLFSAIDPFGGGSGSDWTITTMACLDNNAPIVSASHCA